MEMEVLEPEDIRTEKMTVNYLILRQMERVNQLLTFGVAGTGEHKDIGNVNTGVKLGLRSIESMMKNNLPDDYFVEAAKLKTLSAGVQLNAVSAIDNPISKWYDLIVEQLPRIQLVPAKKKIYTFATGVDGDDTPTTRDYQE